MDGAFAPCRNHGPIRTFVRQLREAKGAPRVLIEAAHWTPEAPLARGFIGAGDPDAPPPPGDRPLGAATGDAEGPPGKPHGFLKVGERVEFRLRSPRDGWVNILDLGTSGTVLKLVPSAEHPDNAVRAGEDRFLPSPSLLARSCLPSGDFDVKGPTSAEAGGEPERMLAIVTARDVDLAATDLHPKLVGRHLLTRCAARGAGFSGAPRTGRALLFELPPDEWDYGLLEMEVRA